MIHAGQFSLHVFGGLVRNVQVSAAMLGAAAFAHFGVNGAGDHVAGGKLHPLRVVTLHEALAGFVAEDAAFAANRFRDENALHAGRPNHARGMELDKFHVHQLGSRFVSERHPVARVFPGIRCDGPGFADAAGSNDHGLGFENHEAALLAPVAKGAGDAISIFEQPRDRAFHVHVEAHLHAAILKRSNHLETGAVAHVAQPFVGVSAESALQNLPVIGAIEERAPVFELAHAVGGFLRVNLRHAPVVEHLPATHGVAEMGAPIVRSIHVGHGRGNAAFGHYRMCFAEQRFAHHAYGSALAQRLDRRAQARAARADDQDVMLVGFEAIAQSSLTSRMAPQDTSRTYKSAKPTERRLAQANSMWRWFKTLSHCQVL